MNRKFAVCLRNKGYEHSLQIGKLYEVLSDKVAAKHGMVRVVDEEGEDYLYMAEMFYPLTLPKDLAGYLHERELQFS
jgi:hypothetical protein